MDFYEEEEYEAPPPKPKKPKYQAKKEIFIDAQRLEEIAREIAKSGESPISSAPDPRQTNNLKPKFTMEELPNMSNNANARSSNFCCGKPAQIQQESEKSEPVSFYSVCIIFLFSLIV